MHFKTIYRTVEATSCSWTGCTLETDCYWEVLQTRVPQFRFPAQWMPPCGLVAHVVACPGIRFIQNTRTLMFSVPTKAQISLNSSSPQHSGLGMRVKRASNGPHCHLDWIISSGTELKTATAVIVSSKDSDACVLQHVRIWLHCKAERLWWRGFCSACFDAIHNSYFLQISESRNLVAV